MRRGLLLFASVLYAQTAPGLRFDVASIKLDTPNSPPIGWKLDHGSFTSTVSVSSLIQVAYNLGNSNLIEGGPGWMQRERYDVIAKGDPSAGPEEIRVMLQALLAERFHLEVHREPKNIAGYTLVVDTKKRARLPKAEEPGQEQPPQFLRFAHGFRADHATFDQICGYLWTDMDIPIVNGTGLRGIYSFRLDYNSPQPQADATKDDAPFGTVFSAFENIGLNLTATKVPVEVLHIDRLDRPTEN